MSVVDTDSGRISPDRSSSAAKDSTITSEPKRGTSHVFTLGERKWSYTRHGPYSAPPPVQLAVSGYQPISWSVPPTPKKGGSKSKGSSGDPEADARRRRRKRKKGRRQRAEEALRAAGAIVLTSEEAARRLASSDAAAAASSSSSAGAGGAPSTAGGAPGGAPGGDLGVPGFPGGQGVGLVHMCRFPGCHKIFALSDGCRKHARKMHPEWLKEQDRQTKPCFQLERAWRDGAAAHSRAGRAGGGSLPQSMLVNPPQPQPGSPAAASGKQQAAGGRGDGRGPSNGKARLQAQPSAPAAASAAAPFDGSNGAGALAASSMADSAVARHHQQRKRPAPADADANVEASSDAAPAPPPYSRSVGETAAPEVRWSKERCAYDAVLPHGASWSMRQIEWFVGTWWRHLANASVATFDHSLTHFSEWASDAQGLDCLLAWLPQTTHGHEDLVTLQILELLEYAELRKLPALERLCDLVRGLEHHADRQVAETAERVTKELMEVIDPTLAPPRPAGATGSRKKARADEDGGPPVRGRGGWPKSTATGSRKVAKSQLARRGNVGRSADRSGYAAIDDGYRSPEDAELDDPQMGCFCGTDRHLPTSKLPFAGVWVQCELCERWCHGECAGMTQEEADAADYFHCALCSDNEPAAAPPRQRAAPPPPPAPKAPPPNGGVYLDNVDAKLWQGAAAEGWQTSRRWDEASSEHVIAFHHPPTGKSFSSRAEAVLHAAIQHQRAGR